MKPQNQGRLSSHFRLLVIAGLAATGCSSTAPPPSDINRDLVEMQERILELQEKAAMAEVELARLRRQIALLGGELSEPATSEPVQRSAAAAETLASSSTLAAPTATASSAEEIEESDIEPVDSPGLGQAASQMGGSQTLGVTTPVSSPATSATPAADIEPVEPAAQALYDRGYTLYHQGRYLDAESSFQRFLQAYPRTELSDNAQYWIGEARFARGDFRGALAAFRETIQRFPEGNKLADAMIKEGDCLASLGDRDGARERYDEVRRRFPDSAAAVIAEEKSSALN